MFNNIHGCPRRRVASTSKTLLTHLLLPALVARSLDSRLSSSLPLIFIVVSARARTALELGAASLPLVAPSSTWTDTCGWARSPATHGSLTSVHAGRKGLRGVLRAAAELAFDRKA
jgi:hypothetical protein